MNSIYICALEESSHPYLAPPPVVAQLDELAGKSWGWAEAADLLLSLRQNNDTLMVRFY